MWSFVPFWKVGLGVRVRDPRQVSGLRAGFPQDPAVLQSSFPILHVATMDKIEIWCGPMLQLWEEPGSEVCCRFGLENGVFLRARKVHVSCHE